MYVLRGYETNTEKDIVYEMSISLSWIMCIRHAYLKKLKQKELMTEDGLPVSWIEIINEHGDVYWASYKNDP